MRCASPADWLRWQTVMAFKQTQSSRKSQNYQNTRVKRSHQIMKNLLFTVFVLLLLQLLVPAAASQTEGPNTCMCKRKDEKSEANLAESIDKMLKKQSRSARPVLQAKDNVTVYVGLSLLRLQTPQGNSIEADAYLRLSWRDPKLTWDPKNEKYGGAKFFAVPAGAIWLPDIRSYSLFGMKPDNQGPIRVRLYNNGSLLFVLPARIRFDCDKPSGSVYNCTIKFGSWVHDDKQLDIKTFQDKIDLRELQAPDYIVLNTTAWRQGMKFPCCPDEQYIAAGFNIMVKPNFR